MSTFTLVLLGGPGDGFRTLVSEPPREFVWQEVVPPVHHNIIGMLADLVFEEYAYQPFLHSAGGSEGGTYLYRYSKLTVPEAQDLLVNGYRKGYGPLQCEQCRSGGVRVMVHCQSCGHRTYRIPE